MVLITEESNNKSSVSPDILSCFDLSFGMTIMFPSAVHRIWNVHHLYHRP